MSDILCIELEGESAKARGQCYGESAREQIKAVIEVYRDIARRQRFLDWDHIDQELSGYIKCAKSIVPDLVNEIDGIAQGAGCRFNDIFALNCRSEILLMDNAQGGCSSLAVLPNSTRSKDTLLAQNWDWHQGLKDHQVILKITNRKNIPNLVTFTEAGQLAKIGMNDAGIALCVNNLTPSNQQVGLPWVLVARKALESANFTEAMGTVLHTIKGHSMNYMIAYADGVAVDIESNPTTDRVIWPEHGVLVHTNHYLYQTPRFIDNKPKKDPYPSTYVRYFRMKQFFAEFEGNIGMDTVKTILRDHVDHPFSICLHDNPRMDKSLQFTTCLSIIMNLNERTLTYTTGNPCKASYRQICL